MIKRCFLLGMKAMTNVGSILKSRDINLLTKVCIVKATVFPVVMYGCENWAIKKAEHQRIDAFELWSWRRLLRVPWRARRSNLSILKEISPAYSLEGLMLKLKFQYFSHLMWRANSLEKTLMLEGTKAWEVWRHRMRWLDTTTDSVQFSSVAQSCLTLCDPDSIDVNLSKLPEIRRGREAWHAVVHEIGHNLVNEQQTWSFRGLLFKYCRHFLTVT